MLSFGDTLTTAVIENENNHVSTTTSLTKKERPSNKGTKKKTNNQNTSLLRMCVCVCRTHLIRAVREGQWGEILLLRPPTRTHTLSDEKLGTRQEIVNIEQLPRLLKLSLT